jgi:hypothetical protein
MWFRREYPCSRAEDDVKTADRTDSGKKRNCMKRKWIFSACLLWIACLALPVLAGNTEREDPPNTPLTDPGNDAQKTASDAKAQPPSPVSRWLELQSANLITRYRYIDTSTGIVTSNQQQHQENLRARLKFDARGKYSLVAGLGTGSAFTSGYNNTGWNAGSITVQGSAMVYLKQLYLSAAPIKGVELQFGGILPLRGEVTEITSYDNDAYITGERLSLKRPKDLLFDEISVTYAYLGDLTSPGMNKRFRRLDESNYHQFLVAKKIGERTTLSFDYTFHGGVETLRQGLRIVTKEFRVIDSVRFENYQRVDYRPDYGYALYAEKALNKKVTAGGGMADIDQNFNPLNGDRFFRGKRLFGNITWTIFPELNLVVFLNRAVGNDYFLANRTRFDVVLTYNVFRALQRSAAIKRALLPK